MDFLRSRIRRTKLGELAFIGINALLPVALLVLVHSFDSLYPALALVLLSKWRILALRPRFWLVNIKANAVDLLLGASVTGLLYISMPSLPLQLAITLGYGVWLLYLKPKSSNGAVMLQAGIAQFLALSVLFSLSVVINEFLLLLGCFVIGYSCARHVMSNYEEENMELFSYIWGMLVMQMGWLMYHWTMVYNVGLPLRIPQIALVVAVVSFVVARLYNANKTGQASRAFVQATVIFGVSLLAIVLFFARWDVTI